jgi:hypothetical protein
MKLPPCTGSVNLASPAVALPGEMDATEGTGLLPGLSGVRCAEWRNLIHIEIPPDDEVSRVSRADLFLEHIR